MQISSWTYDSGYLMVHIPLTVKHERFYRFPYKNLATDICKICSLLQKLKIKNTFIPQEIFLNDTIDRIFLWFTNIFLQNSLVMTKLS